MENNELQANICRFNSNKLDLRLPGT